MSYFYLDTSVVVHALLGHSNSAAEWLDKTSADESNLLFSSRVLRTELTRVLRREGLPIATRDEVLDFIGLIPLTEAILIAAEAIVPPVKTLDAIHLASVIGSGLDATIVTHDAAMTAAAYTIGYPVFDPIVE